jgi:hypothetical protein
MSDQYDDEEGSYVDRRLEEDEEEVRDDDNDDEANMNQDIDTSEEEEDDNEEELERVCLKINASFFAYSTFIIIFVKTN